MKKENLPVSRRSLQGGILALIVVMGIGRFAYTPILPLMQERLALPDDLAGFLASANYLGYLIGAVWAGFIHGRSTTLLQAGLVVSIATTGAMGWTADPGLWIALRFLSGLSSGLVFVLASGAVLQTLALHGGAKQAGWLFAGVGAGISLTGLLSPPLGSLFGWRGAWIGLAVLALPLGALAGKWLNVTEARSSSPAQKKNIDAGGWFSGFLPWLTVAYFCIGLGYIVTGTFLVAVLERSPAMAGHGASSWVIVGLAGIPSCVLWVRIGARIGYIKSLVLAHLLLSAGIILPVVSSGPIAAYLSALLFGGTFMGITALALSLGRLLSPSHPGRMISILTASFGIGQIIGPAIAGILAEGYDGFAVSLAGAAGIVALGAILLTAGSFFLSDHDRAAVG